MSTRPELLRLLQACKREPDDDHARLVLADWLEEFGDAEDRDRAAFVRLVATCGEGRGRPDFLQLISKWRTERAPRWAPFRSVMKKGQRPDICNGLLAIEATHEGLCGRAARRWAGSEAWAWVEQLTVKPDWGGAAGLFASPLLAGAAHLTLLGADRHALAELAGLTRPASIHSLELPTAVPPSGLAGLVRSPFVSGLRSLRLVSNGAWGGACEALGAPGALPELQQLSLPDLDEQLACAAMLRSASWRLKGLEAPGPFPPLVLDALTRGEPCAGLRRLYLGGHGELDFPALAGARFWPTLEGLVLHSRSGGPGDVAALARCEGAPCLRVLSLYAAGLEAPALASLADSPLCAALDALNLSSNSFGPGGAAELTRMPAAPRRLDLRGCYIGDEGLEALAAWPGLARCRSLCLDYNRITEKGAAALAASPHAAGLVGLDLFANPIGDEGLERLLKAGWASRLEELDVNSCRLTMRSTKALLAADLKALRQLQVDHEGRRLLKKELAHVPFVG